MEFLKYIDVVAEGLRRDGKSWAVAAFEGGMALPMITKTLWILWISCGIN